jgi:hypothetical protein
MSEPPQEPPPYTIYRTRPRLFGRNRELGSPLDELRGDGGAPRPKRRLRLPSGPWSVGRVVRWLVLAVVAWIALSLVLFLVSAQLEQDKVSDEAEAQLTGGG